VYDFTTKILGSDNLAYHQSRKRHFGTCPKCGKEMWVETAGFSLLSRDYYEQCNSCGWWRSKYGISIEELNKHIMELNI